MNMGSHVPRDGEIALQAFCGRFAKYGKLLILERCELFSSLQ